MLREWDTLTRYAIHKSRLNTNVVELFILAAKCNRTWVQTVQFVCKLATRIRLHCTHLQNTVSLWIAYCMPRVFAIVPLITPWPKFCSSPSLFLSLSFFLTYISRLLAFLLIVNFLPLNASSFASHQSSHGLFLFSFSHLMQRLMPYSVSMLCFPISLFQSDSLTVLSWEVPNRRKIQAVEYEKSAQLSTMFNSGRKEKNGLPKISLSLIQRPVV